MNEYQKLRNRKRLHQSKLLHGKVINPDCLDELFQLRMEKQFTQQSKKSLREWICAHKPWYCKEAMEHIAKSDKYAQLKFMYNEAMRFYEKRISIKKKIDIQCLPLFLELRRGDKGTLLHKDFLDLAPEWMRPLIDALPKESHPIEIQGQVIFLNEDMFRVLKK